MCSSFQILIADRDAAIRCLLTRIVSRSHPTITITAVADGAAALQHYQQHGSDLLLSGGSLSGLDGLSLVAKLRAEGATVPIILLSGNPQVGHKAQAVGATAFLPKPFDVTQLLQLVTQHLPHKT